MLSMFLTSLVWYELLKSMQHLEVNDMTCNVSLRGGYDVVMMWL